MLHAWPTSPPPAALNCRGRLLSLDRPRILGILNLTPDSFSDGGLLATPAAALARALVLLGQGADVLDLGAVSTRPGAAEITPEAEWARLAPALQLLRRELPDALLSIDTWRAEVAQRALDAGADIINDISGGQWEPQIMHIAAQAHAPYILMHTPAKPDRMQAVAEYPDVFAAVYDYFVAQLHRCQAAGLTDVVLDPGFGFGKTLAHNYTLLRGLEDFTPLGCPLLVGISRKRMLTELTGAERGSAELPLATALHLHALQSGARLLRVHDVAAAHQARLAWEMLQND